MLNKYSKSIIISVVIMLIITFYILFNIDWSDDYLIDERIIFNYADTSKDVVNNLLVSIITGLITILAVILTIEHTNVINDENKKIEKEIQYRAMNKQNADIILSEIRKFYANACYLLELENIEKKYRIKIFADYCEVESINKVFLNRLSNDFFYDELKVKLIGNIILMKPGQEGYFRRCQELFNEFYGFSDKNNETIPFEKYKENARLKLYFECCNHRDNRLKPLVNISLENEEYFEKLIELPKDERNKILNYLIDIHTYFYPPKHYIPDNSDHFNRMIKTKHKENCEINKIIDFKFKCSDENEIINHLYNIYKGLYGKVDNVDLYQNYGSSEEQYKKVFLEKFKIDRYEDGDSDKPLYRFVEQYHYL